MEKKGKKREKKENVERTRRSSMWPLGADKPAATRSISRKRDGELYRSIRYPHPRLRIQLPLSAGAIYRETNGDASLDARAYSVRTHGVISRDRLHDDLNRSPNLTSHNEENRSIRADSPPPRHSKKEKTRDGTLKVKRKKR